MKHLQTNTLKSLIFVISLICYNLISFSISSQDIKNSGIVTETISPLMPPSQSDNNNFTTLNNNQEINSFLEKLENSDNKALNFPSLNKSQNENISTSDVIIFNEDNISKEVNVFNDNYSDQLLQEFSNNNVTFDNLSESELDTNENSQVVELQSSSIPSVSTSKLASVKISSLGLEDTKFLPNGIIIWNDVSFERALYLLEKIDFRTNSSVLKELLNEVLSISQDPPIGETSLEIEFINKKLELIANLHQLETLYTLIDLLPDDTIFDHWRALRVEHLLLKGEFESDSFACKIVNDISVENEDEFWKKAQIFCQIILGNEDDAIFDAELLRASGSQDNNFFNLLYSLIGQKEDFIIEEDKLELLHIIMMDQIRNIIPSEFIFKTPQSNYPVLLNIENIQAEAKSLLIDNLVENQIMSKTETQFYYDLIGDNSLNINEGFQNIGINLGPQLRADFWKTVNNYTGENNLNNYILNLINIEANNGRPIQALKLYSEFLILPEKETDPNYSTIKDVKLINKIYNNSIESFDGEDSFILTLLSLMPNNEININILSKYNIEDLIPILDLFNISIQEGDYIELYLKKNKTFESVESDILLKLALNKASEENNLLEALTIQSLLINDLNISLISSNTVYEIVKSLNSFGLTEISRDFTREWVVSKIITNITEDYSK
jgi:hypothetical protein